MATRKIRWTQKTGANTSDILYPETDWDSVLNKPTFPSSFDFVSKSGDKMSGSLTVAGTGDASQSFAESIYGKGVNVAGKDTSMLLREDSLVMVDMNRATTSGLVQYKYTFPAQSGEVMLKGNITWDMVNDKPSFADVATSGDYNDLINKPNVSISNSGSGNAVTSITASGHTITVTKGGTFATTSTASSTANGLMSSTDKSHLDSMWSVWSSDDTTDTLVNKVQEVLAAFASFKEGDTIIGLLSNKVDKTTLDTTLGSYVKKSGDTMSGSLLVTGTDSNVEVRTVSGGSILHASLQATSDPSVSVSNGKRGLEIFADRIVSFDSSSGGGGPTYTYNLQQKTGTFAFLSDLQWLNITGKPPFADVATSGSYTDLTNAPSSLPPSGTAGGDLTGSYPNPTLKTSGVTAGTYSAVTVNTKGLVTAGANLFTTGTSSSIPSSVPTNGFYLQYVS